MQAPRATTRCARSATRANTQPHTSNSARPRRTIYPLRDDRGGADTHTGITARWLALGLRAVRGPRDARAAKRNFGDPAGGKSGWFRGGFKIVKGSLPQAEFKVVKVSDLLENQPPPYAHWQFFSLKLRPPSLYAYTHATGHARLASVRAPEDCKRVCVRHAITGAPARFFLS